MSGSTGCVPKKLTDGEPVTFSITLSERAHTALMEVVGTGLFGMSRAEVARTLIGNQLVALSGQGIIRIGAAPAGNRQ